MVGVLPSGSTQVAGWVPASCQPACSYRAMAGRASATTSRTGWRPWATALSAAASQGAGQAQAPERRVDIEPGDAAQGLSGQTRGPEQAVEPHAADEGDMAGDGTVELGDPGGHHAAGGDPAAGIVRPAGRVAAGLVHPAQRGDARGQVRGRAGPDWHVSSRRVRRAPRTGPGHPRPGNPRRAAGARAGVGGRWPRPSPGGSSSGAGPARHRGRRSPRRSGTP